ncbi:probable enoyl-CoA hydratase isoform X2 [Ornithodoros turicata]|uniref:probable enoyl-CoA hydratase isoform X2 n=1 Tax=Ornithodoros turicata TaxID=34597 RepID=UPI0031393BE7
MMDTSPINNAEQHVTVEKQGNICLIGINRPEKRNCVNMATARQLQNAFQEFEQDDSVAVAILHGKGGTFCAGFDLEELSQKENFNIPQGSSPMGPSHMLTKKPTIAAISGYAVAGGLELALLCDLRVVEDTAVMGVFCRRFGVPLLDGGTVRLPRLIGLSRALDLILTGRPVTAKEAFEIGLANRIVACGTGLGQAVSLAGSIAKFPQGCVQADKASAYYSSFDSRSLQDALNFEHETGTKVISSEAIKGAKKFMTGVGRHGSFNLFHPAKDSRET